VGEWFPEIHPESFMQKLFFIGWIIIRNIVTIKV
jgi:hypothetical protein